jgi:hypothetical protein
VDVLRAGVLGLVVTRHEYAGYGGHPGTVFWSVADARGVLAVSYPRPVRAAFWVRFIGAWTGWRR